MKIAEIVDESRALQFKTSFLTTWNHEYSEDMKGIDEKTRKDQNWTKFMVGKYSKSIKGPECSFLKRVCKQFIPLIQKQGGPELELWLEWYTVDACIVEKVRCPNWCTKSHWYMILEHENGNNLEEEMWKLLHFKAPLKVLIAYDYYEEDKKDIKKQQWLEEKIKVLNDMNSDSYKIHPESDSTEYLLVVGNRDKRANDGDPTGKLKWRFWHAKPSTSFQEIR